MIASAAGLAHIKEFEGLRLKAYKCPASVLTIGYGHTSSAGSPNVIPGMIISREEADAILKRDIVQYEDAVTELLKVEVSQGQFDALVDFAYNVGVYQLERSTLLKRINARRFDEVPAEFMKWTRGGGKELSGLVRRRREAVKMWRGLETVNPVNVDEARVQPDTPMAKRTISQSREANGAVVAGGAGAIAIAREVMPIVQDGGSLLSGLNPTVAICLIVVAAAAAIWYFRKQRLDEEGA